MKDILTVTEHQEIFVAKKRNLNNNTISEEDRELLFDIVHRDRDNKNRYVVSNTGRNRLKVNSIVGSISLKTGLTIEILPKFAKNSLDEDSIKKHRKMLINILRVSKEKNFISSNSQNSKVLADEMPLLHYVIELFSEELLSVLRSAVYANYNTKIENSSHVRGTILVSKTIQNNIIDKSKVYVSYNQHSANNLLMQIFRTLAKMLLNDKNLSYKSNQNLHEVYLLLDNVEIIKIQKYDFKKITFNRLNDKFETLFTQAEFIFNQYMPFTSSINSTPFWSILFDMNYLFEKFCTFLFRKSNIEIKEQSIVNCFKINNNKDNTMVSAKPEFIIQNNKKTINVIDAKWKMLDKEKSLYGLNAQNFWQLFSYMNLINQDKEIKGYFIVPKYGDSFKDKIIFTPIKNGNKSINILSVDFSLGFEELINKYSFEMIDDELTLIEKVVVEEPVIEEKKIEISNLEFDNKKEFQFNLETFIQELEKLHNNRNLIQKISTSKQDNKFKHIFYLKEKYNTNSKTFKLALKANIERKSWSFDDLNLIRIPSNIKILKKVNDLSFRTNKIISLPNELFQLNKLEFLDLSNNNIRNLPEDIKELKNLIELDIYANIGIKLYNIVELKSLKLLVVDKHIIENNIEIIKEIQKNKIKIQDSDKNDLTNFIDSILAIQKDEKENEEDIETIINLTLENYEECSDENKLDFCELSSVDFSLLDEELVRRLCYEKNKDIPAQILYKNTTPLRFIVLISTLYFNDKNFREKEILEKEKTLNSKQYTDLISSLNNNTIIRYIENNFLSINDEILFGLAMNNMPNMIKIREKISDNTDNLELLDELSKNENDYQVLYNIIMKSSINEIVKNKVIDDKYTIYSLKTLSRIARYKQYYKKEDETSIIHKLAINYNLSEETKDYLFDTYQDDDRLLMKLKERTSYGINPKLKTKIEEKLSTYYSNSYKYKNEEPFNSDLKMSLSGINRKKGYKI